MCNRTYHEPVWIEIGPNSGASPTRNMHSRAVRSKPCRLTYGLPAMLAGALLMLASSARLPAQNLYVANWFAPGAIYQFTPGGSQSTFYSGGLGEPEGLAFDSSGNLFVADSL